MAEQREIEVKPQVNIYTVLLIVTILALGSSTFLSAQRLFSKAPEGYALEGGDLFTKWDDLAKKANIDKDPRDVFVPATTAAGDEEETEPQPEEPAAGGMAPPA